MTELTFVHQTTYQIYIKPLIRYTSNHLSDIPKVLWCGGQILLVLLQKVCIIYIYIHYIHKIIEYYSPYFYAVDCCLSLAAVVVSILPTNITTRYAFVQSGLNHDVFPAKVNCHVLLEWWTVPIALVVPPRYLIFHRTIANIFLLHLVWIPVREKLCTKVYC